jgi:hypothetical protein
MYWYFFGGGSGAVDAGALTPAAVEELGNRVGIVVQDSARAEAAQSILDDLGRSVVSFEKNFAASAKGVNRSYRDHAADPAEIEAVLEQLNRDWQRGQERVLDFRFELRDQLTRQEWEALYTRD